MAIAASAAPVPATPRADIAVLANARLSRDDIAALLLVMLGEQADVLSALVDDLAQAGYLPAGIGGRRAAERYLIADMANRLGLETSGDLFAVMVQYLRLVAREAREDRLSSSGTLATATIRLASSLGEARADLFADAGDRWLRAMRTNLRDVSFDQIIGQAGEIVSADTRKTLALLDRMLESLKRAAADRDFGRTPVLPDEDDDEDEGDESTPGVCLNCDGF